jgi:hypothetical protein
VRVRHQPDYTLTRRIAVGGSRKQQRRYSEYWTLIRGVTVRGAPRSSRSSGSAEGPQQMNQAGPRHCGVEVTTGD